LFLQDKKQSSSMDRAKRDAATAQLLRQGYDLLMKPLEKEIRIFRRLTICGDGQLLFLPFELLRKTEMEWGENAPNRSVGDLWEVRYLNAARDLLREHSGGGGEERKTAFLVGNPEFGLEIPSGLAWEASASEDDGILLANEIGGLDLGKTRLAILSSSELPAGGAPGGEGITELRGSLIRAGNRDVVHPLWPAGPGETAEIMERFCKRLSKGEPVPTALADARGQVFREVEREEGLFEAARRVGSFIAVSAEPSP
jgi:CHAT domain-containing protein